MTESKWSMTLPIGHFPSVNGYSRCAPSGGDCGSRSQTVPFGASITQGLGSPIASRLAYTQKSRGQNLPGDHFACSRRGNEADHPEPCNHLLTSVATLPRGVIRSAPVSDTGGLGAKPGEAATFISTKNKHLNRETQ